MANILAADLFCGSGGTSEGLMQAATDLGIDVDLLAINHWDVAIASHTRNHPEARHMCANLAGVHPTTVVPDGKLDLLWASPECTNHSNARGGKPMSDQSRASAWHICHWAEQLDITHIIIENVPEFQNWGVLIKGRPDPKKKGWLFEDFKRQLRRLGYRVEHRVLNAAHYGDATTRRRFFLQARKIGTGRIIWPEPTHLPPLEMESRLDFGEVLPWRTAREIIDWTNHGKSIYGRKKSLSPNTMRRIYAGLQKFSGLPFVVNFTHSANGSANVRGVDQPIGTVMTKEEQAVVEPFLVILRHTSDAASIDSPVPTVCAGGTQIALCQPFIVPQFTERDGQSPRTHDVDYPLPTVTSHGAGALVEPFLMQVAHSMEGDDRRTYSLDTPVPTITQKGSVGVVDVDLKPYVVNMKGQSIGRDIDTAPNRNGSCGPPVSSRTRDRTVSGQILLRQ